MSNEQTKYEEINHDDKGVLCGYTEEEGWVALEECCEECGCTDCECEEELQFGCKYCRGYFDNGDNYCRSCNFDLNFKNEYCYNMYVCRGCGEESEDPDFTECCEGCDVLAEGRYE